MSPTMHMSAPQGTYIPTSDVLDRHDYGINKNRKIASTGGGRAWSEDEEVYLLQTRLQKMPYKHIAAHLKKTELACRLHYHQLSHGSNRRKRTTSVSSGSSTGQSPTMATSVPSPIQENTSSRSSSPLGSTVSYGPASPASIQLPSIMTNGHHNSSRLPAILPKPASMTFSSAAVASAGYPTPILDSTRSLGPSAFPQPSPMTHGPSLRLDTCRPMTPSSVDIMRLQSIYTAHRSSFWAAVASDYGTGVSPVVLEQAWKMSVVAAGSQTPITPITSPNEHYDRSDRTRISAILGIDANPRSPREREMVRRLEEERAVMTTA